MSSKFRVRRRRDDSELEEGSFFVLRRTDPLATAVLYAYVAAIQTQLEEARKRPGFYSEDELRSLEEREEHVLGLAQDWQREAVAS